jgi:hypothetical protein
MSWTRPQDLRAQVQRLWDRGELLKALVNGQSPFPRRLVLKGPTSSEMFDQFDELRDNPDHPTSGTCTSSSKGFI